MTFVVRLAPLLQDRAEHWTENRKALETRLGQLKTARRISWSGPVLFRNYDFNLEFSFEVFKFIQIIKGLLSLSLTLI